MSKGMKNPDESCVQNRFLFRTIKRMECVRFPEACSAEIEALISGVSFLAPSGATHCLIGYVICEGKARHAAVPSEKVFPALGAGT